MNIKQIKKLLKAKRKAVNDNAKLIYFRINNPELFAKLQEKG